MPADGPRIVIAGGGIAAMEALMALADLGEGRLNVHLLADREEFALRPQQVGELWGGPPLRRSLREMVEHFGATLERERLLGIDAARGLVIAASGARIPFDELIVAVGAQPGLPYAGALTLGFGSLPGALAAGAAGQVAIVVPPGTGWTLPAYQLALQIAASTPGRVRVITPEAEPLATFGRKPAQAAARLLATHHVTVAARTALPIGSDVSDVADTVLTLPLLHGPAIDGLPADFAGFHPVDALRRVEGLPTVHVAGDAAAGHIKQGGLAAQQAEVAARDVAARAGLPCAVDPYRPVLRGKLVAPDGEALYLRRALDRADAGRCQDTPLWRPEGAVLAWRLTTWLAENTDDPTGLDPLAPVARPPVTRVARET